MVLTISSVVILALLVVVGFFLAKVWFQKDTEAEDRRREAVKLAAVMSNLGLKLIPAFLTDYAVGDYSGMVHKLADMARLFSQGEDAVVKEFEVVFERVLEAKLRSDSGRALIAAKLADSRKTTDPTVVQNVVVQPPATVVQPQYQQ